MMFIKNKKYLKVFCCFFLMIVILMESLGVVKGETDNQNIKPRYQFRRYTDNTKALKNMYYHLYIPENYDESIAYPLVIYLSLIGQDVAVNSMKYIDSSLLANGNDEKYPCIIFIPLIPEGYYWVNNYFGEISPGLDLTISMTDYICQKYSVDQRKIYISGMCSTATGAWDALARFPEKFAAGVLVANIAPTALASQIQDVPLWIFNSDSDPLVSVIQSREVVKALNTEGNTEVKYTEYHNYDHVKASIQPFWETELFPWMFSQTNLNAPYPEGKIPIEDYMKNPNLKNNTSDDEDVSPEKTESPNNNITENNESPEFTKNPNENDESPEFTEVPDNNDESPESTEVPNDELIIQKKIKDNTEDNKKINLRIVCIFIAIVVCLGVIFFLLYKKILHIRPKNNKNENEKILKGDENY